LQVDQAGLLSSHARNCKQHQVLLWENLKVLGRLQRVQYRVQPCWLAVPRLNRSDRQKSDARSTFRMACATLRVNGETVSYTERVERKPAGLGRWRGGRWPSSNDRLQAIGSGATLNHNAGVSSNTRLPLVWDASICRHKVSELQEPCEDYRLAQPVPRGALALVCAVETCR